MRIKAVVAGTIDGRVEKPSRGYLGLAYVGTALLLLLPLLSVTYPPLADYPWHLARSYVIANLPHSPELQRFYHYQPGPYPNLAVDVILPALGSLLTFPVAGKLFLAAYLLLLPLAIISLSAATGKGAAWSSLLAVFLVYNFHFLAGLVNYCASMVLFFFLLGLWVRWREQLNLLRTMALAVAILALYFTHVIGMAALFVSVLFCEFAGKDRWRNLLRLALIALPTGVIAVWWWTVTLSSTASGVGTVGFSLAAKIRAAFGPVRTYGVAPDTLLVAMIVAMLAACWGVPVVRDKRLLVAGGILAAIFVLTPQSLASGTSADDRFLLPAAGVLLASVDLRPRWPRIWLIAFALLFVGRVAWITHHWRSFDTLLQQQVAGIKVLPQGARVYPLVYLPANWSLRTEPELHFYMYGVIEKRIYAPSLAMNPAAQGVRNVSGEHVASHFTGGERQPPIARFRDYDYVWSWRAARHGDLLKTYGDPIFESGDLRIYRLRSNAASTPGHTP